MLSATLSVSNIVMSVTRVVNHHLLGSLVARGQRALTIPLGPLLAKPDLCRALTLASLLETDAPTLHVVTRVGGNTNLPQALG